LTMEIAEVVCHHQWLAFFSIPQWLVELHFSLRLQLLWRSSLVCRSVRTHHLERVSFVYESPSQSPYTAKNLHPCNWSCLLAPERKDSVGWLERKQWL